MGASKPVLIYLDNAATTRVHPRVVEAMTPFFQGDFGNPSSLHPLGATAASALSRAKEDLLLALGLPAGSGRVVLTGGATEANNLLIKGLGARVAASGSARIPRIVSTRLEHPSSLESVSALGAMGWKVDFVDHDPRGRVDLDHLQSLILPETRLVSLIWGNNEIGTVIPAVEISRLVRSVNPRTVLHFDAVQCLGKLDLRLAESEIDAVSLSGHKIHGPKGVGALVLRRTFGLEALLSGGDQEYGLRAGTENVAFAVALAEAVKIATGDSGAFDGMGRLRDRLRSAIEQSIADVTVHGDPENRLPHLLSVSFEGLKGEVLLHHLEREGVCVATGAACSERSDLPSHVLAAIGIGEEMARSTIRFSLSRETTEAEIDLVAGLLPGMVAELRLLM